MLRFTSFLVLRCSEGSFQAFLLKLLCPIHSDEHGLSVCVPMEKQKMRSLKKIQNLSHFVLVLTMALSLINHLYWEIPVRLIKYVGV